MQDIAISISNLSKEFPGRIAISEVSFNIFKGRIHGFLGPNGAGKSTTMKILSGVLKQTSGEFKKYTDKKIGYLSETPPLYENMTVLSYLLFVGSIYSDDLRPSKENALKILEKCGLEGFEKRLIRNLSKGQKQRVGIASTLVFDPEIIILDEPTVGLDPNAMIEIRSLIKELSESRTVLLSTHQLHEASLLCDDITIINKGKVIMTGTYEEISKRIDRGQRINLEVLSIDIETLKSMEKDLPLSILKKEENEESTVLELEVNEGEDIRPRLSTYLIGNNIDLLSMSERKSNLEDIFSEATHV